MTDEKKPADLNAGGAETGSRAPDEVRRKLAKAALASPVIMTLAPRSVFGQACESESIAAQVANSLAGGTAILSARPAYTEDCKLCVKENLNNPAECALEPADAPSQTPLAPTFGAGSIEGSTNVVPPR